MSLHDSWILLRGVLDELALNLLKSRGPDVVKDVLGHVSTLILIAFDHKGKCSDLVINPVVRVDGDRELGNESSDVICDIDVSDAGHHGSEFVCER